MRLAKLATYIVITLAFILHMGVIVPSGTRFCYESQCGNFFWGAHEHDGIWHLALTNAGLKNEAVMPNYAGAALSGYNALLDIGLNKVSGSTGIKVDFLYFKILPIAWFGLLTWIALKFAKKFSDNHWYESLFLFFIYFGNSFSYLFTLVRGQGFAGASGLITMQSPQTLTNIQYALSLPILVLILTLCFDKNHNLGKQLALGFLAFMMIGLKFYGGVIAGILIGLYYLIVYKFNDWKKGVSGLIILAISSLLGLWLFYSPGESTGSIFKLTPLAMVHPIIEEKQLFYLPQFASARYSLMDTGFSPKLILIEVLTILIFVVMNFGTRVAMIPEWIKRFRERKFGHFEILVVGTTIISLMLTTLLSQRGEWWNTIQFLYYSFFLANIYAAAYLANLIKTGKYFKIAVVGIVIILTIPNSVDTWKIFSSMPPRTFISDKELHLLERLRQEPEGVVLALPLYPSEQPSQSDLAPLYHRYDTAYVSAYSGKQTYLNDLVQLRLMGIDYSDREQKIRSSSCETLSQIKYIYVAGDGRQIDPYKSCSKTLVIIESNEDAALYRIEQ